MCVGRALYTMLQAVRPCESMCQIDRYMYISKYLRRSPCQYPGGNLTTRKPSDHRKETLTEVVWSCLPLIRTGHNYFARQSETERGKNARQTEGTGGKTTLGNGQAWSSPSPRGQLKTGENGGNWL